MKYELRLEQHRLKTEYESKIDEIEYGIQDYHGKVEKLKS